MFKHIYLESSRGVVVKVLNCGYEVYEFELYSVLYIYFRTNASWKRYKPFSPSNNGFNSITVILQQG